MSYFESKGTLGSKRKMILGTGLIPDSIFFLFVLSCDERCCPQEPADIWGGEILFLNPPKIYIPGIEGALGLEWDSKVCKHGEAKFECL